MNRGDQLPSNLVSRFATCSRCAIVADRERNFFACVLLQPFGSWEYWNIENSGASERRVVVEKTCDLLPICEQNFGDEFPMPYCVIDHEPFAHALNRGLSEAQFRVGASGQRSRI